MVFNLAFFVYFLLAKLKHEHDYHVYYKLELKNEIPLDDYSRWATSTKWEK